MNKSGKFDFGKKGGEEIAEIAKQLGITPAKVLKNGVLVMALYAKLKKDNKTILVLKDLENNTERELLLT